MPDSSGVEVAVRQLLRVAAHDLAQPLQVAYGYLELLRDQYGEELPGDAATWLASSIRSLDRSRVFVREMLRYSRIEPPVCSAIDLNAAAAQAIEELDTDLPATEVSVAGDLPTVRGDGTQLAMLLGALIDNAVRHGVPVDGETPMVEVTAEGDDGWWTITVADRGPGIPSDRWTAVLEPFERGLGVARPGLGLAIARVIVTQHAGRLWIEDREGGGAAVRFIVPG